MCPVFILVTLNSQTFNASGCLRRLLVNYKYGHCHKLLVRIQILGVLCLRLVVVSLSPKKALKCVLAILLHCLTVEISDVPCTG